MRWLVIVAVVIFAQQPAKAPKGQRTVESEVPPHAQSSQTPGDKETDGENPQKPTIYIQKIGPSNPKADTTKSGADVKIQGRIEVFTGLLVIVGFLQAGVMFLQWCVYRRQAQIMAHQMGEMTKQRVTMGGQLEKMEGQLLQMQSAGQQTERLIAEATKSANAASKGAEAALSNAHAVMNAERAWIMADVYWSADVPNENPTALRLVYDSNSITMDVSVVYTNEGDTPAWITESKILLRIVKILPMPPDFTPDIMNDHWLIGPRPITPHGRQTIRATVTCEGLPKIGEDFVVIYGYLKYRDVFSPDRETRFGYKLTPNNRFERIVGEGDFWQYNSYT